MEVKLVMFKPNGQRKDFPLVNAATIIGRGEKCGLRVPIVSVSRQHCELLLDGDRVTVKDMGSSNGTYVNNRRITERDLKAGDRVVVGPVVFTVQIDGQPDEIRPVKTRGQKLAEAKHSGSEEVVPLETDAEAEEFPLAGDTDADVDPISALEALASEGDKKQPKGKK